MNKKKTQQKAILYLNPGGGGNPLPPWNPGGGWNPGGPPPGIPPWKPGGAPGKPGGGGPPIGGGPCPSPTFLIGPCNPAGAPICGGSPPGGGPPIPMMGSPLPAGLEIPGPAAATPAPAAPPAAAPRRDDGSAGGGDSTERVTMWIPRRIMRPSVRFSSEIWGAVVAGGAEALVGFRLIRRNSSVSARTMFMCFNAC